ncbi:ATP-binding protein [Micromonospora sp. NPDC005413]|uniref:ATP-binding protein n=1 Tax=Micromonospora sp. NPDC005413 TaxID=3154563 RepID=UPI0033A7C657
MSSSVSGGRDSAGATEGCLVSAPISAADLTRLRHAVAAAAGEAGLADAELDDFVLAVHELVANVIRHGGGVGHLQLCRDADVLTCRISDHGPGLDDVTIRLPGPAEVGRRGLWLAQRLSAALVVDSSADGLTVAVSARLPPPLG